MSKRKASKVQERDASDLRDLKGHTFDLVVSIFEAMFAPKPLDVAMVRVARPGGRIVMANWIPSVRYMICRLRESLP